jgi:hypothetical protein
LGIDTSGLAANVPRETAGQTSGALAKEDHVPPMNHQTIVLGRGKHTSPDHGACVMELASMLAGEPFSDHPRTVSPAIGSFLRNLNDVLDDERRQSLYAYAACCVGTADTPEIELARAEHLIRWGDERWRNRARQSFADRFRRRAARERRRVAPVPAARYAIAALGAITDESQAAALELVDQLVAIRSRDAGTTDDADFAAVPAYKPEASRDSPICSALPSSP